ncbi:MAG: Wzz/FepE/Etk N-terminal domain-containing protein [Coriobacteriaceae bacterium]|nr:Wzz/FepE/Etk N-terminal domain-containing protein [Coriobacteriaceae bacterium]
MTLLELLHLLRKHLKLVIALPIVFAIACGVVTLFMPNQYTASTTMYVLSKNADSKSGNAYSDLTAGQLLSNDVASIAKSSEVKSAVANSLGTSLSPYDVKVDNSTTTRVITLSVTGPDPQTAANIANAYVQNISSTAQSVMDVQGVNVMDAASAPTSPSGPKRPLYIVVALLVGLFLAVAIVVIADMVNTKVRSDEDVEELLGISVVGHFPDIS